MKNNIWSETNAPTSQNYCVKSPSNDWSNGRITNAIGLSIDLKDRSLSEICAFENEQAYDVFADSMSKSLKECNAFMKYDVMIVEPNGCKISYTFELFKKIIFPKNENV